MSLSRATKRAALSSLTKRLADDILMPTGMTHWRGGGRSPIEFRIRGKRRCLLGGGYFFRSSPNLIAAITSISNAMVSAAVMRSPPCGGTTGLHSCWRVHDIMRAASCQFVSCLTKRLADDILTVEKALPISGQPKRKRSNEMTVFLWRGAVIFVCRSDRSDRQGLSVRANTQKAHRM